MKKDNSDMVNFMSHEQRFSELNVLEGSNRAISIDSEDIDELVA